MRIRRRRWVPDKRGLLQALAAVVAAVTHTAFPVGAFLDFFMAIGTFEENDLDRWHYRLTDGIKRWAENHRDVVDAVGGLRTGWAEGFLAELDKMGASVLLGSDDRTRQELEKALARTAFAPLVGTDLARRDSEAAAHQLAGDLPELLVGATGLQSGLPGLLQVLRSDLAEVLDRLPPGPADRAVCETYLDVLADEMDHDPWTRMAGGRDSSVTLIAARLRVTARPDEGFGAARRPARTSDATEDAADLAARCERMVLLGDPGAGKSWLARCIVIDAAGRAGEHLAAGADPATAEIPLLARCPAVFGSSLSAWEAVVAAALAQVGHRFGSGQLAEALRRRFFEQGGRYLVVLDGLDEADHLAYGDFLDRLANTADRELRIVLTGRPESWRRQLPLDARNERHRVAALQPLAYPGSVMAVIGTWLADAPQARDALAARLAGSAELAQAAGTPLLCAMYCLLAETGDVGPLTVAELLSRVITRLLQGTWRGRHLAVQEQAAARKELRRLAWAGAANNPVTGLSAWPDVVQHAFEPPLAEAVESAVSHVAPEAAYDPERSDPARQFLHPLIREYLVAEYVAALPSAEQAMDAIEPHLWYDRQWQNVLPWAVAAHREHDALLDALVRGDNAAEDLHLALQRRDGQGELRRLLVSLAAQTSPDHWSSENTELIDRAWLSAWTGGNTYGTSRITVAARGWPSACPDPGELACLAQGELPWTRSQIRAWVGNLTLPAGSRRDAIDSLADLLCGRRRYTTLSRDGQSYEREFVVDEQSDTTAAMLLHSLRPAPGERDAVIHGLFERLKQAADPDTARAVRVLTDKPVPSSLLAAIVNQIPASPEGRDGLGMPDYRLRRAAIALDLLGADDDWRREATARVLRYLKLIPPGQTLLDPVTEAIVRLRPDARERVRAIDLLLARAYGTESSYVRELMDAVGALLSPPAQAGAVLVGLIRVAGPWRLTHKVGDFLGRLSENASEDERATAVRTAADRMASCGRGEEVYLWALHLMALHPTDAGREAACALLVAELPRLPATSCGELMMAARELRPTPEQCHKLLDYLLRQLETAGSDPLKFTICEIATWFSPSGEARRKVVGMLLDAAGSPPLPFHVQQGLKMAARTLPFTSREREELCDRLLTRLPSGGLRSVTELARLVIEVGPTDGQRARIVGILLALLKDAESTWEVESLLELLCGLNANTNWRAPARNNALAAITAGDDIHYEFWRNILPGLSLSEDDRRRVVSALVPHLQSEAWRIEEILTLLDELQPTPSQQVMIADCLIEVVKDSTTFTAVKTARILRGRSLTANQKNAVTDALTGQITTATPDSLPSLISVVSAFPVTSESAA